MRKTNDVSLLTLLLHHPFVYRPDANNTYKGTWNNTTGVSQVFQLFNTSSRHAISTFIDKNVDFLVSVVMELILRNIHVASRNIVWYSLDEDIKPVIADVVGYNSSKDIFYVINLCYSASDLESIRNCTQNTMDTLCSISSTRGDIRGFIIPVYTYRDTWKIRLIPIQRDPT